MKKKKQKNPLQEMVTLPPEGKDLEIDPFFLFFFLSPSGSVIKKPRAGMPILRLAGKYPAKITYKYVGNFKNMMCAERIIKTRISEAARERQSKQTPLRVSGEGFSLMEQAISGS